MRQLNWACGIRIFHVVLYLLLFATQLGVGWASDTRQKKTDFGIGVMAGDGLVQYHHTCIWFRVFFISDDFFSGLRETKTVNGPSFEKHRIQYHTFPDHLVVDVEATVYECPLKYGVPPDYGASLIEGASFEVSWQGIGETQMHPTNLIPTKMDHHLGMKWDYFLELHPKDVPLTDVLNIAISLRQGTSHAYLRAGLHG